MSKYKLTQNGVLDQENHMNIPNAPGNRHWCEYQEWLVEGNTPDPEFTEAELIEKTKNENIEAINAQFVQQISLPAECTIGETVYYMDAKYDSAMRFKAAIDMATLIGETEIQMVDFNNKVHTVSMADANSIVIQQAIAYRMAYMQRAIAREAILNS